MVALVDRLERWAAEEDDVTVVFERPPSPPMQSSSIMVVHAPEAAANWADDEIVRLVQADTRPQEIRVVTSDNALIKRVKAEGLGPSTRRRASETSSIRCRKPTRNSESLRSSTSSDKPRF